MPATAIESVQGTLGCKLMELIKNRNLTVARAAEMLNMSKQQLFRLIQGDVPNPGIFTLQDIVVGLGYRMTDLFDDA